MSDESQIGWAILELMGHRKLAGFVSDENGLLRIDVYLVDPDEEALPEPHATQWYGRPAIYCITASTKDMCLRLAQSHQPAPVGRWELAESTSEPEPIEAFYEDEER